MNWNTMGIWIRQGDVPNYTKLANYAVGVVYIDPRDPNAKSICADIRAHGLLPGLYYDVHWFPGTQTDIVKWISDRIQVDHYLVSGEPVMLDIEQEPLDWTDSFLKLYRTYLTVRPTSVTMSYGQDPSIVPVSTMVAKSMHLYTQLYAGDMSVAPAPLVWSTNESLQATGLPATSIHPFYDGADIPWNASDGCIFTQDRLP